MITKIQGWVILMNETKDEEFEELETIYLKMASYSQNVKIHCENKKEEKGEK